MCMERQGEVEKPESRSSISFKRTIMIVTAMLIAINFVGRPEKVLSQDSLKYASIVTSRNTYTGGVNIVESAVVLCDGRIRLIDDIGDSSVILRAFLDDGTVLDFNRGIRLEGGYHPVINVFVNRII